MKQHVSSEDFFFIFVRDTYDKKGIWTPFAWRPCVHTCVCVCAHRERVRGLAWSFHPAIFNIWTAHCAAEFKPLVSGMFTEVFPSETSKPNTGADPQYLTSIWMGERRAAGWVQDREERDGHKGFHLRHEAECSYTQERRQIQHSKVISALMLCKPKRLILFVSAMNQGQGFLWVWGRLEDIEQCICFTRKVALFPRVSGISFPCHSLNLSHVEAPELLFVPFMCLDIQISRSSSRNIRGPEAPSGNSAFLPLIPKWVRRRMNLGINTEGKSGLYN